MKTKGGSLLLLPLILVATFLVSPSGRAERAGVGPTRAFLSVQDVAQQGTEVIRKAPEEGPADDSKPNPINPDVISCVTSTFESSVAGYTVEAVFGTPLWHRSNLCRAELAGHSTPITFYMGQDDVCNYNTGARTASNLLSPIFDVTGPATLEFNYLLFVEGGGFDTTFVDVSTNGGVTWAQVLAKADFINDNQWHTATVDLSPFIGAATSLRLRFRFDSVDNIANSTTGWHIDDIQVCGTAPALSMANASVTEGTGGTTNAIFNVTLAAPSTQAVTVDYVTSDGTASAPGDYTSEAGTLTFAPGVTTQNIVVPIIGDSLPEPSETFFVTLFNPNNATIDTTPATGTINDDDATGALQFSAPTTSVAENAIPGSVTLTINRTGNTSGGATVGFETSDISAQQKSDYTFNSGTVQFAPGDTSKTIDVLIVDDAFVEGSETFRVNLLSPSGNFVVGPTDSIIVTITDDDAVAGPNPIDTTGFFVRQQYLDFLGREPDAAGLAFWTNNINSCGADAACVSAKRVDTSAAFFLSIEFQETSGNVIRTQRVAFGKQSADAGSRVPYLQFMRDTRQIGQGVIIGQPGATPLLEQNKQAYATQIVNSAAFISRYPFGPAATYVDALSASAGVVLTAAERTAAITAYGAGGTSGRVAALRSVADSNSLRAVELSPSFVLAEFYGYLRRNPTDAPDFNDSGYQFWLNKLNAFSGDFRQSDMVKSFILSGEYRQRFGAP